MKKISLAAVLLSLLIGCGGRDDSSATPSTGGGEAAEIEAEQATLAAEPIPAVMSLPSEYPKSWFFAHDLNFFNMLDGKIVILDAGAETREYKGQLPAGMAAGFAFSKKRKEIYITETIHERRVRGARHDYLTAYAVESLQPLYEIELPNVRYQGMPYEWATQLIENDRFLLIFNFSPAATVTVVDLEKREVVNQIGVPGCAMIYPTGRRGFSTLCGNGGMTTIKLDENGQVAGETKTETFFDIDHNALFMSGVVINGRGYFPTYLGDMQPIDFAAEDPVLLEQWPLLSADEKASGLRPGGWQFVASNGGDEIFMLIHEQGAEGTHKNPSADVFVYSMTAKKKLRQLTLKTPAISIALTGGETPYLVAFNIDLEIDIYDADSGDWLRKIGGLATETSFAFYSVQ